MTPEETLNLQVAELKARVRSLEWINLAQAKQLEIKNKLIETYERINRCSVT